MGCSRDTSVWIWEKDDCHEFEVVAVKRSHDGDVKCVQWHPFDDYLLSCSYDDSIKAYKCDELEDDWFINQIFKTHKSTVWKVRFDPMNGHRFVSCSDDLSIVIWQKMKTDNEMLDDMAFTEQQCLENVHDEAIYCVDWMHDEDGMNVIASCSGDNCINLYCQTGDDDDGKWKVCMEMQDAHQNDVNWIEFGKRIGKGKYLIATASDDGKVKIWEFEMEIEDALYDQMVNEID